MQIDAAAVNKGSPPLDFRPLDIAPVEVSIDLMKKESSSVAKMNLENLSVEELKQLQKDTKKAITSFEERKRADAVAELETVAQKHGFRLADLIGGKKAKIMSPAKYKHSENASLTWTGRGRQPKWIKDGLAAGKSLDDFAI